MSGAATGGILAARAGPKAMASAAVVGGIILALIEGMGIWMNNYFSMPPPGMEGEKESESIVRVCVLCFWVVLFVLVTFCSTFMLGCSCCAACNFPGFLMHSYLKHFIINIIIITDPNAMAIGPPVNDITAPPISGGLGMIPTGLSTTSTRSSSQSNTSSGGMITMGGGEGESERFDAGGHETTFSMGGISASTSTESKSGGGGWWPFGGGGNSS